jgi:hypothetical protein
MKKQPKKIKSTCSLQEDSSYDRSSSTDCRSRGKTAGLMWLPEKVEKAKHLGCKFSF